MSDNNSERRGGAERTGPHPEEQRVFYLLRTRLGELSVVTFGAVRGESLKTALGRSGGLMAFDDAVVVTEDVTSIRRIPTWLTAGARDAFEAQALHAKWAREKGVPLQLGDGPFDDDIDDDDFDEGDGFEEPGAEPLEPANPFREKVSGGGGA